MSHLKLFNYRFVHIVALPQFFLLIVYLELHGIQVVCSHQKTTLPVLGQNPDSQPKKQVSKEQKINESESDLWVPGNFLRSPEERLSRPGEP